MNSGDMTTDTSSCASSESEASDNAHAHNEDGSSYDFNLHQANSVMNNLASSTDKGMCMGSIVNFAKEIFCKRNIHINWL